MIKKERKLIIHLIAFDYLLFKSNFESIDFLDNI